MLSIIAKNFLVTVIAIAGLHCLSWNVLCQNHPITQTNANQPLTFRAFLYSRGETKEGNLFSENVYLASDGEEIYRRGVAYSSPARANEELENKLKSAVNILERKPVMEKKRKVGERVVALFSGDNGREKVLILRTYQMVLVSIEAPSLRHALAFEKFDNR
jgi:hypothetical protein